MNSLLKRLVHAGFSSIGLDVRRITPPNPAEFQNVLESYVPDTLRVDGVYQ